MKRSEQYREFAEDSLRLASTALDDAQRDRYRRMADSWRALAEEEEWFESRPERLQS